MLQGVVRVTNTGYALNIQSAIQIKHSHLKLEIVVQHFIHGLHLT